MMRTIRAKIEKQNLIIIDRQPLHVAGTVGLYALSIEYDAEWEDATIKAVTFSGCGVSRTLLDTGDIEIPHEVIAKPGAVKIGVVGVSSNGELRITTSALYDQNVLHILPATAKAIAESGRDPKPTPSIIEQIQGEIGDLSQLDSEDKSNLVAAINEALQGGGGGGVSKKYVDDQDAITLQSAKDYTDAHHDDSKQDTISDLTEIRSGASAGATALQPAALTGYATEQYVNNHHDTSKLDTASVSHETWQFTLSNDTVVEKEVMLWQG